VKSVRGVLLDLDGTLIDSNDAHADAWVKAMAEHGYIIPYGRVRNAIGMGSDKLLSEVLGVDVETGVGQEMSQRHGEIFTELYLPSIKPFPGVKELVNRMQTEGLKVVVATSASDEHVQPLLEVAGVQDLLKQRTSSENADNSKPDPDIVQAALKQTGYPPGQVVMIGDTPYDVIAANKAGVAIIALRCGGWSNDDLAGAIAIYEDPADLLRNYDSSPLASARTGS
jgi:HAD superfamily hydrolase (TIGR01549 family)